MNGEGSHSESHWSTTNCNSRRTEARASIREERTLGKGHSRQRKQHKQRPGSSRKYQSERCTGAWPGGWLEGHVGPGGKGASGWPHPFPLAPEAVPLCQVPLATMPGSLGSSPSSSSPSAATQHPCPGPGFHRLPWASVRGSARPPWTTPRNFRSQPRGARKVGQVSWHVRCGRGQTGRGTCELRPSTVYLLSLTVLGSGSAVFVAA